MGQIQGFGMQLWGSDPTPEPTSPHYGAFGCSYGALTSPRTQQPALWGGYGVLGGSYGAPNPTPSSQSLAARLMWLWGAVMGY